MTIDEVLEVIHRNGVGEKIECFFKSKGVSNDYNSLIINYKYQKGLIKIFMDRFHAQMHEKNLVRSPYCELLITDKEQKETISLRLFCKFWKIEDRCIYVKALNVKYQDGAKEINHRLLSN